MNHHSNAKPDEIHASMVDADVELDTDDTFYQPRTKESIHGILSSRRVYIITAQLDAAL